MREKHPNIAAVTEKAEECNFSIESKFSKLPDEDMRDLRETHDTNLALDATHVGGKKGNTASPNEGQR